MGDVARRPLATTHARRRFPRGAATGGRAAAGTVRRRCRLRVWRDPAACAGPARGSSHLGSRPGGVADCASDRARSVRLGNEAALGLGCEGGSNRGRRRVTRRRWRLDKGLKMGPLAPHTVPRCHLRAAALQPAQDRREADHHSDQGRHDRPQPAHRSVTDRNLSECTQLRAELSGTARAAPRCRARGARRGRAPHRSARLHRRAVEPDVDRIDIGRDHARSRSEHQLPRELVEIEGLGRGSRANTRRVRSRGGRLPVAAAPSCCARCDRPGSTCGHRDDRRASPVISVRNRPVRSPGSLAEHRAG